ncbi:MAG TPA: AI-2E family transporter [Anaerolineales bacterium]|nr:AI-2E family transporter [Anaerolineales bacterium]
MKPIIRNAFTVFAALAGMLLLWQFSLAVILFLISLVVTSAMRPAIDRLAGRGLSRAAAIAAGYGVLVLIITGMLVLFAQPFLTDAGRLVDDLVTGYERIKMDWPRGGTLAQRTLAEQLPPTEEFYSAFSNGGGLAPVAGMIGAAQTVLAFLAQMSIVIVLSVYWTADRGRIERSLIGLLPERRRKKVRQTWSEVEAAVGSYVRGELVQSLVAGILLGLLFSLLGVPYPFLLAVWIACVRLIPWFGTILAILPSLLAIAGGATAVGITSGLAALFVLVSLRLAVEPRYFDRRRVNGLWMAVAILSFAELWGPAAALLAPTFAVAGQLVCGRLVPAEHPL